MKSTLAVYTEKFVVGLLALSSTITSITVLLIVFFLFQEGLGLFEQTPIAGEQVLVVNRQNPVKELSANQVKEIFDQEITNWK